MTRFLAGTLLFAAAALVGPAEVHAQQPSGAMELPAEVRGWLSELEHIHQQLAALQERALQDPQLSAQRDSLGNNIRVAMESVDPSLADRMNRIPEMEAEAAAAEAQGNDERLMQLSAEAQRIEQQFMAAQNQALQNRPELAAEVLEFQSALQAKILEADPRAPELIARMQELEEKLATAAQGLGEGG